MNWRSLLGAWYAQTPSESVRDLRDVGFRDEFTTGWNEAHGRLELYVYEWSDFYAAARRDSLSR